MCFWPTNGFIPIFSHLSALIGFPSEERPLRWFTERSKSVNVSISSVHHNSMLDVRPEVAPMYNRSVAVSIEKLLSTSTDEDSEVTGFCMECGRTKTQPQHIFQEARK